jgi:hypothetical protein
MSDTFTFQFGPLVVRVEGDHPVVKWAQGALDSARCDGEPVITFRFASAPLSGDLLRYHLPRFDLVIRKLSDRSAWEVDVFQNHKLPSWLRFLTTPDQAIDDFVHWIVPFLLETALLNTDCTMSHAAAMAVGEDALLIVAAGRVGKTSVLLPAMLRGKAKFLADDHAIVDAAGNTYLNPMPMQLYGNNLDSNPQLRRFDSIQRRIGRKVSLPHSTIWAGPRDVFGTEKLASKAHLSEVIVLIRGSGDTFDIRTVEPNEAAGLCGTMIAEDLPEFLERLSVAESTPGILPTATEACDAIRRIFTSAFAGRRCSVVTVPLHEDADELMRYLRKQSPLLEAAMG